MKTYKKIANKFIILTIFFVAIVEAISVYLAINDSVGYAEGCSNYTLYVYPFCVTLQLFAFSIFALLRAFFLRCCFHIKMCAICLFGIYLTYFVSIFTLKNWGGAMQVITYIFLFLIFLFTAIFFAKIIRNKIISRR